MIELSWVAVDGGKTIGNCGSENGTITLDEIVDGYGRITMEKCQQYCAITCGVYGGLVHTTFCTFENGESIYRNMKSDLLRFFDSGCADEYNFYDIFTAKYC